ncbi:MAG: TPR end-of-group domain-containing protein [Opitutales bacterium]
MSERDLEFEVGFFEGVYKRGKRDTRVIEILGHLYTKTGKITEGLRMDRTLVRLEPENALAHYNLACSLALKKRKKEAVASLENAVSLGYSDLAWMCRDPDLESLEGYHAFDALIERLRHIL